MVSLISMALAASLGFLVYLAIPFVVMGSAIEVRKRVGRYYLKLGTKSLKQFAFVRRVLSGYDILPIDVDDEQKLLKVTLSSSTLGENNEYRFKDPDNRILRLFNKPVALAYEQVPAAIDAELAELGHWVHEKHVDEGLWDGDMSDPDNVSIDPYVEVSDGLHLVDPIDAYNVVVNDVDAENIKTAEKKTKKRFEKYSGGFSPMQMLSGVLGFATGVGGVMALRFFQDKFLDGSSASPPPNPVPILVDLGVVLV